MFYHEGMKRSAGNAAKKVFGMVTTPLVTEEGLETFARLLKDSAAFEDFLSQDGDKIIGFLDALYNTQGEQARDLFVTALSLSNAVAKLSHKGHAKWLVEKIETLTDSQVTDILTSSYAVFGLAIHGQAKRVAQKIDQLDSIDHVKRICHTPNAMRGLADSGCGLWVSKKHAEISAIEGARNPVSSAQPSAASPTP